MKYFLLKFVFPGKSGITMNNALQTPEPVCSKLTTPLVNVSLKFEMLIPELRHYFLSKNVRSFCNAKASLIFSTKNISVFGYEVVKHLKELTS